MEETTPRTHPARNLILDIIGARGPKTAGELRLIYEKSGLANQAQEIESNLAYLLEWGCLARDKNGLYSLPKNRHQSCDPEPNAA